MKFTHYISINIPLLLYAHTLHQQFSDLVPLIKHAVFPTPHPHTCSDSPVCDEPFYEVISVSLHMSVITQNGDTALMTAVREGRTEVVSLLLEAGANIHLQNKVKGRFYAEFAANINGNLHRRIYKKKKLAIHNSAI